MSLDWPPGWERTPAGRRTKGRKFQASLGQTTKQIEGEMKRMDVDDWRGSIANQHTKSNGLPLHNANPDDPGFVLQWSKDGDQFAVACDAYSRVRDNVRAVYLWIHETRLRSQRPVKTGDTEFAAARLPAGDDVVAAGPPPHEVLDISPDASRDEVLNAYKKRLKEVHPDQGGDPNAFKRVVQAKEAMLDE